MCLSFKTSTFLALAIVASSRSFPLESNFCREELDALSGSSHTNSNFAISSGSMADFGTTLKIGGITPKAGLTEIFRTSEDLTIEVEDDAGFKGVLVRVEVPNGLDPTGVLLPYTNVKIAPSCVGQTVGIIHNGDNSKTIAAGTLRFDADAENVPIDVIVVYHRSGVAYEYSFSRFFANFTTATPEKTDAPTTLTSTFAPTTKLTAKDSECIENCRSEGQKTRAKKRKMKPKNKNNLRQVRKAKGRN